MKIEVLNGAIDSIQVHKPIILVEILKSGSNKITKFLQQFGYDFLLKISTY